MTEKGISIHYLSQGPNSLLTTQIIRVVFAQRTHSWFRQVENNHIYWCDRRNTFSSVEELRNTVQFSTQIQPSCPERNLSKPILNTPYEIRSCDAS